MIRPRIPHDEAERLAALRDLGILDTPPEERFDRFTRLAQRLFRIPIALVSLVDADRQWCKSCQGLDARQTPREISFCGHAILGDELFVVEDAMQDERFIGNPLVDGDLRIRFYAGYPLKALDGAKLGTFCIIDQEPRKLEGADLEALRDLGRTVETELAAFSRATTDELTRLSNRRGFKTIASKAIAACQRFDRPASLLALDVDHFKAINDQFGYAEGDRALIEISRLLVHNFRDSDVIARTGCDEFCVLLSGASAKDSLGSLQRLHEQLDRRSAEPGCRYRLTLSAGVVAFDPRRHTSLTDVLHEADSRMNRRKRT